MQFSLEEAVLNALCSEMPEVFYLDDLLKQIENDYQGELSKNAIKQLVECLLSAYEDEHEPIIQSLGIKPSVGSVYRKLFTENEQGQLIKSRPKIPDLFEIEHIKKTRQAIKEQVTSIESRIFAYDRLNSKFPKTEDWADAKLANLLQQKQLLMEDITVIDELLHDISQVEKESNNNVIITSFS
ncbi:hypothetical protein L1D30_06900 [Vibrio harveyi]|uniref:hypothetical protein n=1 Tax=Vibrio TaxID=662 RepID=UPI001ECAE518|nr:MULTISPECIES: hypothetical protein [Vibrio]MCG9235856.1 hypothetical protein [Vibrio harveyi]MCG9586085.1 hypothetical protein [Vibrio harveyi]NRB69756.1 hypothetical protein [Vibrio sp.]